jgi:murein DD-endopeptidase MepM/ murein hydrolase activator NlpD
MTSKHEQRTRLNHEVHEAHEEKKARVSSPARAPGGGDGWLGPLAARHPLHVPGIGRSKVPISKSNSVFFLRVLRVLRGSVFCILVAQSTAAPAAGPPLRLPGHLQQGELVIGHAAPGTRVEFDGRALHVGDDGVFVFGLGRDAPATVTLQVRAVDGSTSTRTLAVAPRKYHIERVEGLPQKTVTPDPETAARIAREQAAVAQARRRDDAREDFLHGFALPVAGARISGVYGSQRIDNGTPKAPHMGLDMAVPAGTPIHAPAPGIVTFAQSGLVLTGGTVLIDHGFGLTSSFLHMSRLDVKAGDAVRRGQVIGAAGMTGRATGPHVHWGFNWFGVRLDPALLPKVVGKHLETSGSP